MIIYGWREKNINVQPIENHTCSNCSSHNSLVAEVTKSYLHIFWIPVIPLSKRVYSACTHCKQILEKNEMPPDLQNKVHIVKQEAKTPIWYYTGLIMVGLLFIVPSIVGILK